MNGRSSGDVSVYLTMTGDNGIQWEPDYGVIGPPVLRLIHGAD